MLFCSKIYKIINIFSNSSSFIVLSFPIFLYLPSSSSLSFAFCFYSFVFLFLTKQHLSLLCLLGSVFPTIKVSCSWLWKISPGNFFFSSLPGLVLLASGVASALFPLSFDPLCRVRLPFSACIPAFHPSRSAFMRCVLIPGES